MREGDGTGNRSIASGCAQEGALPARRQRSSRRRCAVCAPHAHVVPASRFPAPAAKMSHPSPTAKPSNPKNPRVFFDVDIGGERGERRGRLRGPRAWGLRAAVLLGPLTVRRPGAWGREGDSSLDPTRTKTWAPRAPVEPAPL